MVCGRSGLSPAEATVYLLNGDDSKSLAGYNTLPRILEASRVKCKAEDELKPQTSMWHNVQSCRSQDLTSGSALQPSFSQSRDL